MPAVLTLELMRIFLISVFRPCLMVLTIIVQVGLGLKHLALKLREQES